MQEYPAHQLDVEHAKSERSLARFARIRERFRQQAVEVFAVFGSGLQFGGFPFDPLVRQSLEFALQFVDLGDQGSDRLQFPVVRRSEYFFGDAGETHWQGFRAWEFAGS